MELIKVLLLDSLTKTRLRRSSENYTFQEENVPIFQGVFDGNLNVFPLAEFVFLLFGFTRDSLFKERSKRLKVSVGKENIVEEAFDVFIARDLATPSEVRNFVRLLKIFGFFFQNAANPRGSTGGTIRTIIALVTLPKF